MKADELKEACESEIFDERINPDSIVELSHASGVQYYSVNDKVAIPIEEIAMFYDRENDVDLMDSDGNEIGRLCFKRQVSTNTQFTDYQLIAFARDVEFSECATGKVNLEKDYLVLPFDMYDNYMEKYYDTAPLWGYFNHQTYYKRPYSYKIEKIIAEEKITLPSHSDLHKETMMRAIQQPFGFERFLKNYHMLELLFDLDLVNEIQSLGPDIKGIGRIMQEYSKKGEIHRLEKVITNRCANVENLASALNGVKEYTNLAKEIFFEYGKDSNPIKESKTQTAIEVFDTILTRDNPFLHENIQICVKNTSDIEKYKNFIIKISTYWIYRIRCSIAHYKIGEYLMSYEDEEFIVKFAEPLLKQIILETFRESELAQIEQEVSTTVVAN
ncbi:hypothetical protein CON84_00440 [Bacillus sp. AFS094228]|nr:hypothetical protein CON84_00440 [Bacillus sp. AFS094228]